ncbi:hypothetical protein RF11_09564 [Thelohanellus kitauei]|uniref:Tc1-like transposase DDE domain-containing protein n=1 Tax=Thelohanellus kitauei TaxID=669202 RepID=A0A0C2ITG2_THEKT|nr:hypothetical protein RF11_09564 [Thelohanellus kitauei]
MKISIERLNTVKLVCFHLAKSLQQDDAILAGPHSIEWRNFATDAGLLAFLEPQDHQFNEVHFCRYFMYAFEQFLSNGIHECVFIIDNVRFHKTNRVQTMLQENGRMAIYLLPYSSFHNLIEKFVLEMEEHCKNSVPKIRNRPI